ncbi:MAG: PIG-L family deacetylase [Armatimonadetes bacterium]|nr:PIG-L family deacetylase [Armatimonadota bacterium]
MTDSNPDVELAKAAKRKKALKRRLFVYSAILGLIYGAFLFLPQQVDWNQKPIPNPNPKVDPDSRHLFSPGTRVLVVTAHPDDAEFYLGAGLVGLHEKGAEIRLVVCTNGDKGYYTRLFTNSERNAEVRQDEQLKASLQYGADVVFLGHPDGRLHKDEELVKEIKDQIARWHAEYVFCFDPEYPPKVSHQDHRRSGEAATEAAMQSPTVKWLLQFSTRAPNFGFDVSNWDLEIKMLSYHASQFHGKRLEMISNMVWENAQRDGEILGLGLAQGLRASRLDHS